MSKFLDTSAITASNGFPVKQGTWDFLQLAQTERFDAVLKALFNSTISTVYQANTLYRLFGVTVTVTVISGVALRQLDVSAGAIMYNDDIYLVDATSFIYGSTPNLGIDVVIAKTQYTPNADPVQFTGGGAPINVHNIFKIKFQPKTTATVGGIYFSGTTPPNVYDIVSYQAFQTPTYVNNFIANVSSPIRFRLDGKTVRIQGKCDNSVHAAVTTNLTLFTLPTGMRPTYNQRFSAPDENLGVMTQIEVGTAGTVALRGDAGACNNYGVYFNIAFDID